MAGLDGGRAGRRKGWAAEGAGWARGSNAKEGNSDGGGTDDGTAVCEKNGWDLAVRRNHSKLLLFDTDAGKFVIETSSNLNENPSVEQFSFEKSEALYDFYGKIFDMLFAETQKNEREGT